MNLLNFFTFHPPPHAAVLFSRKGGDSWVLPKHTPDFRA